MLFKHMKKAVAITLVAALISISAVSTYAEEPDNVTVTASILNLREAPNTTSKILDKLAKGKQLKVIDSSNGWYKVTENGLTGWVSDTYVTKPISKNKLIQSGAITGNNVNIRKGPGLSYNIITQLQKGEKLDIADVSGDWYKVKTSKDITGWVSSSYISKSAVNPAGSNSPANTAGTASSVNASSSGKNSTVNTASKADSENTASTATQANIESAVSQTGLENPDSAASEAGSSGTSSSVTDPAKLSGTENSILDDTLAGEIVEYAKSFLGVKYIYGGTSPETGFDCSGFTKYTFEKFGINLNRVAADQAEQGIEVTKDELMPGDLIFSDTDGGNNNITHVGIYVGEGLFINAASGSTTGKVVISDLNSSYWQQTYMLAKRIIDTQ